METNKDTPAPDRLDFVIDLWNDGLSFRAIEILVEEIKALREKIDKTPTHGFFGEPLRHG